ncbi:MAG: D-alanyl-D-alanine carboxypeptidase/D-alanyl-D-alanine-endopeptidase [Phycisphaeraceae bacterium]|nr:D-alanyl-D-alanine carboxypeptidase/D-alanyl-D-alanine-endopeptidase [Phycisphaeraceae bacterium]
MVLAQRQFKFILATVAVLILTTTGLANVQHEVSAVVRGANLGRTQVGLFAVDLETSEVLLKLNANVSLIPASNMKLLTSAAALHTLGPDFLFKTRLLLTEPDPLTGQVSLILKGDGDPSLGDPVLLKQHGLNVDLLIQQWVAAVQKTGLTDFDQLIIDDRVFDREFVQSSWPVEQLNRWYCAQVAGLNFHDNCLDVYPRPTRSGMAPILRISPESPFLRLSNRAVSGTSDSFWISRKLGTNEMAFHGVVKYSRMSPENVTLHDPPNYLAMLLEHNLAKVGIKVHHLHRPAMDELIPSGHDIHIIQTTLDVVLNRCNKDSQNLFAEALFKRMGREMTGVPGSWETGRAAMRIFLRSRLGSAAASVDIEDGSGMSRDNRVSAKVFVDLLASMYNDAKLGPAFLRSLSIGGKDGTLKKRFKKIDSTILGKSGYIRGVSSLSGYVAYPRPDHPNGPRVIAFSFLFNNFKSPIYVYQIKALQNKIIKLLDKEAAALSVP